MPTQSTEGLPLSGKVFAVTGGARGIGAAICSTLKARGANAVAFDIDPSAAPMASGSIACDVTDEASVNGAFATLHEKHGRLDGIVSNAGIMLEKPIAETTMEDFDRVIAVNLRGIFLMAKTALPYFRTDMADADKPRIVNVASELAHLGRPEYSAYCASKGGVIALTRALARELAPNILVNTLAPGPTDTDMLRAEKNYDSWVKDGEGIPLGRVASAEEVALAAAFLCGPDSRFMTGTIVDVNGGAAMY
jgi:3-oxoacyl-[acyl-carrier protein] reductase